MDSLLMVGCQDPKLTAFLEKLGYSLVIADGEVPLPELLQGNVIDLALVDTRIDLSAQDLCEYLRSEESCKQIHIICLAEDGNLKNKFTSSGLAKTEVVQIPYKIGSLVGKIATHLRLRKFAGRDEGKASLGEINARLRDLNSRFKKELEEARAIQQSLIPKELPDDDRVDMAVSYEPLEEVGGDWYYVKRTPSGKIAVQIADVTGHGLSAAFIGSMTKLAMTAAATEVPAELLKEMNKLMSSNIPEGKFVTMFSYLYDPSNGRLHYARAGHPPALLLKRAAGDVEQLKGEGFAVGFFEDSDYTSKEAQLDLNDVLVVFTDAIPESLNLSGQTYDYDRISRVMLQSKPEDSAAEILTAVLDDFDQFREGRLLKDDVTVIVLKRVS